MVDYAGGAMERNFAIRANSWLRTFGELVLISAPVVMIAGALLFYSWTRTQLVATGYESQSLQADDQRLERERQSLVVAEGRLKHPERIGSIALGRLGMTRLKPSQVLPSSAEDLGRAAPDSLALATVGTMRKSGTRD